MPINMRADLELMKKQRQTNTIKEPRVTVHKNEVVVDEPLSLTKIYQNISPVATKELPKVYVNEDDDSMLQDIKANKVADSVMFILKNLDPNKAKIFVKEFSFGRIVETKKKKQIDKDVTIISKTPQLIEFNVKSLTGELNRNIDFYKYAMKDKMLTERVLKVPPKEVVEDIIENQDKSDLPYLKAIVSHPILNKKFEIINEPGYHEQDQIYIDDSKTVDVIDMTANEAYDNICEWLSDFPFKDESDIANTFALLLTPFIRTAIPTGELPPLFVITANSQGAGKSVLAQILSTVILGSPPGSTQLPGNEDEMRKKIVAELLKGTEVVVLDNITEKRTVSSSSLASAISEDTLSDRKLGFSEMVTVDNTATYILTGNNIDTDSDLTDRACWIRLDVEQRVSEREFKTKTILADTIKHRRKLFSSVYKLIEVWKEAGCPMADSSHRSVYWANLIKGILDSVNTAVNDDRLQKFLKNENTARIDANQEYMDMCTFRDAVLGAHGTEPWTARQVIMYGSFRDSHQADDCNFLGKWFAEKRGDAYHENSRSNALGVYLKGNRNKVFGNHKLVMGDKMHNRNTFKFVSLEQELL